MRGFASLGVVAVVLAVGTSGCDGPAARSPVGAPAAEPTPIAVPILVEYDRHAALRRLEQWGLTASLKTRFEPCWPAGTVTRQRPAPGHKLPTGGAVTVIVSNPRSERASCTSGVASDHDRDVAAMIYKMSRAPRTTTPPPWAPRVSLQTIDAQARLTLSEHEADGPKLWEFPAPSFGVSMLDLLANTDGQYRVDAGPHSACAGPVKAPPRIFAGLRQVSLSPTTLETCLDWWAIDFFLNDVSQIEGMTLNRWEW